MRRPALAPQSDGLITHYYPNDLTCTERVAIVTGGSRGVGREVVRKLANRGYAVVVGYIRDQGAADSIVEEVLAAGGTALTIRAAVADELNAVAPGLENPGDPAVIADIRHSSSTATAAA